MEQRTVQSIGQQPDAIFKYGTLLIQIDKQVITTPTMSRMQNVYSKAMQSIMRRILT